MPGLIAGGIGWLLKVTRTREVFSALVAQPLSHAQLRCCSDWTRENDDDDRTPLLSKASHTSNSDSSSSYESSSTCSDHRVPLTGKDMFKLYKTLKSALIKQTRSGNEVAQTGRKGVERDTPMAYNGRDDAKRHSPATNNKRCHARRDSPAVFTMTDYAKCDSPAVFNGRYDVKRDSPIADNMGDDVRRDSPVVFNGRGGAKLTNAQLGFWTVSQSSPREPSNTAKQTRTDSEAFMRVTNQGASHPVFPKQPTANNPVSSPRVADVVTDQIIEKANANVLTTSPPSRKHTQPIVPTEVKSDCGSDRATNVKSLITLFSAEHSCSPSYPSQHTTIYANTSPTDHRNRITTSYHGSNRISRVSSPAWNVTSEPFKGVQATIETLFKESSTAQQEEGNCDEEKIRCWRGPYSRTDNSRSSRNLGATHSRPGNNNSGCRRLQGDEESHIRTQDDTKSEHRPRYGNAGHHLDGVQSLQRHQRESIIEAIRTLRRFQNTTTESCTDTIDRANCLRPRDVGLLLSRKTRSESRCTNSARNVSPVVDISGGHSGSVLANTEPPQQRGLSKILKMFHRRRSSKK